MFSTTGKVRTNKKRREIRLGKVSTISSQSRRHFRCACYHTPLGLQRNSVRSFVQEGVVSYHKSCHPTAPEILPHARSIFFPPGPPVRSSFLFSFFSTCTYFPFFFLSVCARYIYSIFAGLPQSFTVARYHSLHGEHIPLCLEVTAKSDDEVVMGIRHKTLPFAAVQFHPESTLTSPAHGLHILENTLSFL